MALAHIIDRSLVLVGYLREKGPKTVHNMDTLLLRESMDVIGKTIQQCKVLIIRVGLAEHQMQKSCFITWVSLSIRCRSRVSSRGFH